MQTQKFCSDVIVQMSLLIKILCISDLIFNDLEQTF